MTKKRIVSNASATRAPLLLTTWDEAGLATGSIPAQASDTVRITASGDWMIADTKPKLTEALTFLKNSRAKNVVFAAHELGTWDTSLAALFTKLVHKATQKKLSITYDSSIPKGVQGLIELSTTIPAHKEARTDACRPMFECVGEAALLLPEKTLDVLNFIGDVTCSFGRLFRGRAVCRSQDVWTHLYEASVRALPIVALISLLVGLILAFVGVVQLRLFRAEIYVSSLVAIGMTRIMGAIMTGIVLAGRTGASYAAIIGSMQVNEEVDALTSLGVPPVDYLVLPRVIALAIMTPLLVLYADFMGIVGGFIVGTLVLGIDPLEYLTYTQKALHYSHVAVGVIHGFAFGIVVAIAGCYQGMRSGRSAEAVGQATTSAVVYGIIFIVISTAILTILFNILEI